MSSRLERRSQKKEEREERVHAQRENFRKRERNKKIFNYAILGLVAIALVYGIYAWMKPAGPGQYDDLGKCLTSKGVIMYGTDWCPHCQEQKREFGNSFQYVTYINCDYNKPACDAAGVTGYPTWVFADGPQLSGTQPLATLAARAECQLDGS